MPRRAIRSTSTPPRTRNSGDAVWLGHTHQPYVLEVGDKLVINSGSVGQPRDGDPRASYAVIEDYKVELKRIEYAVEDTVRNVQDSTLPDLAKELLVEVFRTGRSRNGNNNKEDRSYKPEAGSQKSEVRSQKSEVGGPKLDDGDQKKTASRSV
jgi:hypothetical protein